MTGCDSPHPGLCRKHVVSINKDVHVYRSSGAGANAHKNSRNMMRIPFSPHRSLIKMESREMRTSGWCTKTKKKRNKNGDVSINIHKTGTET
ncbi:hypothetical protein POVWA1_048390 [Plasmodium ovale wallikeri]|uniref:Uncharacterized protein n=1 Tax=Plasmodium ovale wallikeri TaxID=864142 RepID=A0A1A8ZIL2_PLAOA|nr:hypothetical protein POVWA1_048390 [Plasmodium ovale wallikeri]